MTNSTLSRVAVVTGGSRGLGAALADVLAAGGWTVVLDGRDAVALAAATAAVERAHGGTVVGVPGSVTDPHHRAELAEAVTRLGRLDAIVANAGSLGPTPLPAVLDVPLAGLTDVLDVNVTAQAALLQTLVPYLVPGGAVVGVTSDAAVEAYDGWGAYAASKAAFEALLRVLAVERPDLHVYAVDPGDMRTAMHQAAFPGEDISDRPLPEDVAAPAIAALLADPLPSGRYSAGSLVPAGGAR